MALLKTRLSSFKIQMDDMFTTDLLHASFIFCTYLSIRLRADRIRNTELGSGVVRNRTRTSTATNTTQNHGHNRTSFNIPYISESRVMMKVQTDFSRT